MDGMHDTGNGTGPRRDEIERMDALDRWRAMLSALSLYAPTAQVRSAAVATLHEVASRSPKAVAPYVGDIAEVLDAKERRTRWDALRTLAILVEDDAPALVPVAEVVGGMLYQQESPAMRRLALHILNAISTASEEARDQVWPLLDEALLTLRTEPEYPAVLASVVLMCAAGVEDVDHLWDFALQGASDRRARVRVLAYHLRQLLSKR
jgi:hypothetical protein